MSMKRYPFYLHYMRTTLALYEIISRIDSILGMTDKEMCAKNKCITIKMILRKMDDDLKLIEQKLLQEEFCFMDFEVRQCEQSFTALSLRWTQNLN